MWSANDKEGKLSVSVILTIDKNPLRIHKKDKVSLGGGKFFPGSCYCLAETQKAQ